MQLSECLKALSGSSTLLLVLLNDFAHPHHFSEGHNAIGSDFFPTLDPLFYFIYTVNSPILTTCPHLQTLDFFLLQSDFTIVLARIHIAPDSVLCIFKLESPASIQMHTSSSNLFLQLSLSVFLIRLVPSHYSSSGEVKI